MTLLEYLEQKLQPQYVGWKDQYKAVLNALDLDPQMDLKEYHKNRFPWLRDTETIIDRQEY